jgi:predicted outer membrane lipoprotein
VEAVGNSSLPRQQATSHSALGLLVACAFSSGVHVALAPEHIGEAPLLGLAFLAAAALLVALGVGIYLRPDDRQLSLLIALLSAALVAAYASSRTVGLPVLHPAPESVVAMNSATSSQ